MHFNNTRNNSLFDCLTMKFCSILELALSVFSVIVSFLKNKIFDIIITIIDLVMHLYRYFNLILAIHGLYCTPEYPMFNVSAKRYILFLIISI